MDPVSATVLFTVWGFNVTVGFLVAALLSASISPAIVWFFVSSKKQIEKAKKKFVGTNFLIVGPEQTGKTSLRNYFIYNHYPDTHPPDRTVKRSPIRTFSIDKGGEFKLDVKRNVDFPGEFSQDQQAAMISYIRPNSLIIMLNIDSKQWFKGFLSSLRTLLYVDHSTAMKLKSIVAVINKIDLLDEKQIKQDIKDFKNIILDELGGEVKTNEEIPIIPSTLFKEKNGEKYGNIILSVIIKQLKRSKPIVEIRHAE